MIIKHASLIATLLILYGCKYEERIEVISYHPNGEIKEERIYTSRDTSSYIVREYFDNCQLFSTHSMEQGQLEGMAIRFYASGDTALLRPYKHGKIHGLEKRWFEDGNLRAEYYYTMDKIDSLNSYWPNGNKTGDLTFENGELVAGIYYHPEGELRSVGKFKDQKRHGIWKYYYPNGTMKEIGEFEKGKRIGEWITFTETGDTLDVTQK